MTKSSKLPQEKDNSKRNFSKHVLQPEKWLVYRPILFFIILFIMFKTGTKGKKKTKSSFWHFLTIFFQNMSFPKEFSFLPKLKTGQGLVFAACSAYFFHKNVLYLIHYQSTKFQYQIFFLKDTMKACFCYRHTLF